MAKLYFRYGAMNSGKTTALLQVAHNYEERGMRVLILKPAIDTKGEDVIVSRLGVKRRVDALISQDENLIQWLNEQERPVHCILVDEVQFFTAEQIDQLFLIALEEDIPAICYGLRTDFLMNGFAGSERLLLLAHAIEELKTICRCGRKALLNARKVDGEFVFTGDQVAIDEVQNVSYESLCGQCYLKAKEAHRETL